MGVLFRLVWVRRHSHPLPSLRPPRAVRCFIFALVRPCSELLIVLWGLFFIANSQEDTPKLKAREFVQPVKEIIRRRSLSVDSGTTRSTSTAEERPHWESAYAGSNPTSNAHALPPRGGGGGVTMAGGTAAAAGFPVIAPVNGGSGGGHHHRESNVGICTPELGL